MDIKFNVLNAFHSLSIRFGAPHPTPTVNCIDGTFSTTIMNAIHLTKHEYNLTIFSWLHNVFEIEFAQLQTDEFITSYIPQLRRLYALKLRARWMVLRKTWWKSIRYK